MAIPDSPNWSSLTDVKAYPQPVFAKPPRLGVLVEAISLGPVELNQSEGTLNSAYWVCNQEGTLVGIRKGINGAWTEFIPLFEELSFIKDLSLTFDQLGRPLVFYRTENSDLKFYWYDPILQENTIADLGQGYDPVTCFDFPQDTGQSFTDMLVFYVRANRIYMRVQRDRFAVEYDTGVEHPGLRLESAGLRVDYRLQVIYTYPGA